MKRERDARRSGGLAFAPWLLLLLGLGACARGGSAPPVTGNPTPDSSMVFQASHDSSEPFLEKGTVVAQGHEHGDATQVSSLIAAPMEGGERFIVGFARADGFPATTIGKVTVEFRREQRVIRIRLPVEVVSTGVTDNTFTGQFADRAFVVRALDETGLYIDLHLRAAALARANVYSGPALVVVDLKQGGEMLPPWPLVGDRVVALAPPRDGRVSYPIEITGYARTFEANVVAELRTDAGGPPARQNATAADYASAWGEYRMRFDDGPHGKIKLFVGEYSAKDGTPQGVTTNLHVE
jgi:Immunoglobulin-like domain of bacterial spore germination